MRLVSLLASGDPAKVEQARARLARLGSRAVPALLDLLEGGGEGARECAMEILADIRDRRSREPIVAQLLDRTPRVRLAAARALAAFPAHCTVAPLERILRTDSDPDVRVAAAGSLISHFQAGFEEPIRPLIDTLYDRRGDPSVRQAAAAVIAHLRPKERRDVLAQLSSDPEMAGRILRAPEPPDEPAAGPGPRPLPAVAAPRFGRPARGRRPDMERWIGDLAAPSPDRWKSAIQGLTALGSPVIAPLVDGMIWHSNDPVYCTRAGMVLRGLGARRLRPIADHLDRVNAPLPLETLVDLVGELEEKPLVYRLKDLIVRLRAADPGGPGLRAGEPGHQRVIAKAHLQLARIGSRVAVDDLKDALRSPDRPLQIELLAAVELIGRKDDLADLLHAWKKGDDWMRSRIQEVFLAVMRRERLRRTNRIFAALSPAERVAFEALSSRPAGPSPRR